MSLLSPQLQAFIAIAEQKTVHGAAGRLHITQTAVTQRIRTLETRLATTLFTRTRRGMMLTTEGEALLRYCNAAKDLEGEALAIIQGAATQAAIQICITGPTSTMRARIIPQCFPVMQRFPNLLMRFNISDTEGREKTLRSGEAQFAIIQPSEVAGEMESKTLKPEQYLPLCSSKWKGRTLDDIITNERIIDFDPQDQMAFNYLKQFNLFEKANHERHFANRTESLAMMLMEGFGYGLLTKEFSARHVKNGDLMVLNEGKIYDYPLALAWYTRPEPPKYFSALIDAIT